MREGVRVVRRYMGRGIPDCVEKEAVGKNIFKKSSLQLANSLVIWYSAPKVGNPFLYDFVSYP